MVKIMYYITLIVIETVVILGTLSCETDSENVSRSSASDGDTDADNDEDNDGDNNAIDADPWSDWVDATDVEEGDECPIANLTKSCCEGNGTQVCQQDLTWSECECDWSSSWLDVDVADDLGNSRTDIQFEWEETDPATAAAGGGGECYAGRYFGAFSGIYRQNEAYVGFGIPIVGHVDIRLTESANGEIFMVDGGKFKGAALEFVPFSAKISGQLNCSTGEFTAEIYDGRYYLTGISAAPGIPANYFFEGKMFAQYDSTEKKLINGGWNVDEPDRPKNGGKGEWAANYMP
jgi:hypothetical protein